MILKPQNQLKLYVHGKELNNLLSLYRKDKLPNKILLSGKKGIGKCTLAYHLINSILSENEDFSYNKDDFIINEKNKSFKLLNNGTSPNFFLIDIKTDKKNIDINQIRLLIKDINKSSLNNKPRFIIIDNSEYLNKNSINALLKDVEEPNNKIYFILIHNQKKLLSTLTSRFLKFNIFLSNKNSLLVLNKLLGEGVQEFISHDLINYYFSPGNIFKLILFSRENDINLKNIKINELLKILIDKDPFKKDIDLKIIFCELLEYLLRKKTINLELDYYNYFIKKIDQINRFNLDEKSFFIELNDKVLNG